MNAMKFRLLLLFIVLGISCSFSQPNNDEYQSYRGKVIDRLTHAPLTYCNILAAGTNIATVTNAEGDFLLKVPVLYEHVNLIISHIGYKSRTIKADELLDQKGVIAMEQATVILPQIEVLTQDANALVTLMFEKIPENYPMQEMFMTAFYRESIRKGRNYVSLSEAVVEIQKQSYTNYRRDYARLIKARKQTDYTKLDTLVFKLMGGPYNCLFLDMMKYPVYLMTDRMFEKYDFTLDKIQWIDDKLIYVVNFNHRPTKEEALYSGTFYIDAASLALKSAVFSLDLTNQAEAIRMFIQKKPFNAKVSPVQADYRMDYIEKDGKWYYAYSRIELGMKVNWKRKLFNSHYFSTIEMAMTDHEVSSEAQSIKYSDRLRSHVIIADRAEGFSDPDFWGPHNVIEPDKPIEAAIRKINKQSW